jgi:hypothetical protein
VAEWLRTSPVTKGATRILTNVHGLAITLSSGPEPAPRSLFLPLHDTYQELHDLLDRHNGQYERLIRAFEPHMYGGAIWACRLASRRDFTGDVFALSPNADTSMVFPREFIECVSDPVFVLDGVHVRVGRDRTRSPECERTGVILDAFTRAPCLSGPGAEWR